MHKELVVGTGSRRLLRSPRSILLAREVYYNSVNGSWDSCRNETVFTNIVILTGAGISRESGLDTFRDSDGIWAKVNVEDVATPRGFAQNPALVHDFYNSLRRRLLSGAIHPNAAHLALANLQRSWKGKVLVVTQNIDDLHERAGSVGVVHIHGELLKARCGFCQTLTRCTGDLGTRTRCPACGASATMRPDVVWFGERLVLQLYLSHPALARCR
jgi:NAD-dependent deacetylase